MRFIVVCSHCGASYARILLAPSNPRCRCGRALPTTEADLDTARTQRPRSGSPGIGPHREIDRFELDGVDREALLQEEARLRELIRLADRVAFLIVATDTPQIDVAIQRAELRRKCLELFPDKIHVYEMIYESRFERLWEQFRAA